jgi:hypothetical protein
MAVVISIKDAKRLKVSRGSQTMAIIRDAARKATKLKIGGFLMWRKRPLLAGLTLSGEARLQVEVMDFLRKSLHQDACAYHAPQEAKRSRAWWTLLFAMGTFRGFPDICILHASRAYFIELKHDSNPLTPDQESFLEWARDCGFPAIVARSIEDVSAFLTEHKLRATT